MKIVAIVILNWNGRKMLERYLPALVRNTPQQAQIIVADNASTDDSMAFLAAHYPDIRCIELYQNLGFAEGYNRALQQVESEYYVLLNSDVEVTENWLQPLLDYMEHHPDVAACQPKLHAVHNPRNSNMPVRPAVSWIGGDTPFAVGACLKRWKPIMANTTGLLTHFGLRAPVCSFALQTIGAQEVWTNASLPTAKRLTFAGGSTFKGAK